MNPFGTATAPAESTNQALFGVAKKAAPKTTAKVIPLPTTAPAAPTVAAANPSPLIFEPPRQNPTWAVQPPMLTASVTPANQNVFGREVIVKEEGSLGTPVKNAFGLTAPGPTTFSSPINFDTDPLAKKLADKFDFVPGTWTPGEGGGQIGSEGVFGSFDLGNGLALKPVQDQRYMLDADHPNQGGTIGFLQTMNKPVSPLKADGTINPDGWKVVSTKSQAMGGIMGTLSVIGAAVGSALFGPANGAVTDLTGSMDGLMTGSLQTVGGGAVSGAANIIKTVAGQTLGMSNAGNGGLATTLASATPAIAATAAGSGSDKLPTLADIEAKTNAATVANATTQPVNATPQATQAATPDNNGLLLVIVTGLALLYFGVKKHE